MCITLLSRPAMASSPVVLQAMQRMALLCFSGNTSRLRSPTMNSTSDPWCVAAASVCSFGDQAMQLMGCACAARHHTRPSDWFSQASSRVLRATAIQSKVLSCGVYHL